MNSESVLIVDDEVEIVELVEIFLKNEGYIVHKAFSGKEGLEILEKEEIHLIILDIMMSEIDGLQVLKRIRREKHLPVILLSAKSQDMDKIIGLGLGADNYMTKPFNPMELVARVKSNLRRYLHMQNKSEELQNVRKIRIRELTIDKEAHKVYLYEDEVSLTPTEYKILLLLAEHPGKVFSAEEIFEQVWEEKCYEVNNTVMVHIWRLREKIEENPKEPKLVETVWGIGYRMEEQVH